MNSEELEQSLRTEFESYLKDTIAEMKQEVSEFQKTIESEFEQHKARIDESVKEFSEKFGDSKELEESFQDSISEHLKLAREDGSKITAAAFEEAEKLKEDEATDDEDSGSKVEFADIRDAINEISNMDSQSEILKSLVHHATQFTPRGAFFIVKNEHLVGWRMFGTEEHSNPQIVREVFFPVSSKTALSESIETLATIEGSSNMSEDNLLYLNKLEFEKPENMYAIPLVARGRGVAVLYADNGTEGGQVNVEALETLMRVAGLTVEVLASTQIAKNQANEKQSDVDVSSEEIEKESTSASFVETAQQPAAEFGHSEETRAEVGNETSFSSEGIDSAEQTPVEQTVQEQNTGFEYQAPIDSNETAEETVSFENETQEPVVEQDTFSYQDTTPEPMVEHEPVSDFTPTETVEEDYSSPIEEDDYSVSFDSDDSLNKEEDYSVAFDSADSAESLSFDSNEANEVSTADEFQSNPEFESPQFESFTEPTIESPVEDTSASISDYGISNETSVSEDFGQHTESANEMVEETTDNEVSDPSVKTRFGDRNVDLPIEVAEDERRLHNDARRFARLLVSEIKLYNEQKVKEGRESSDLYERLREAIDRSREMYDKRVQPPVAAKFDYFNYELINTLAEGEETKLGDSYPGASV